MNMMLIRAMPTKVASGDASLYCLSNSPAFGPRKHLQPECCRRSNNNFSFSYVHPCGCLPCPAPRAAVSPAHVGSAPCMQPGCAHGDARRRTVMHGDVQRCTVMHSDAW